MSGTRCTCSYLKGREFIDIPENHKNPSKETIEEAFQLPQEMVNMLYLREQKGKDPIISGNHISDTIAKAAT